MGHIYYEEIVKEVEKLCVDANFHLGDDVKSALKESAAKETDELAVDVLNLIVENAEIAARERVPMCQDTGVAVFFIKVGQNSKIVGGNLYDAINEGVRRGYKDHFLRFSVIDDPIRRNNTRDNAPAIIHTEIVPGNRLEIIMSAKGGGAENQSALKMLKPSDGVDGIKNFILETVKRAGPNACPPLVVGVGIGGNFEQCAILAKKSLSRPIGERHPDPLYAQLEEEILTEINELKIGPQGIGGLTTALDVKIEKAACHIASLPVAVNLNCHASRHKSVIL